LKVGVDARLPFGAGIPKGDWAGGTIGAVARLPVVVVVGVGVQKGDGAGGIIGAKNVFLSQMWQRFW
jgi:hypothetical protein